MLRDEVEAREAIRYTMSVYNTGGDRGKLDELSSAFLEDGVLETATFKAEGRAAIVQALSGGVESRQPSTPGASESFVRHNLTTSRVEMVSDTEAQGWTYFIVFTEVGPDHMGTYIDTFRKAGERWLIAHRRVKIHWDSPLSTWHAKGD